MPRPIPKSQLVAELAAHCEINPSQAAAAIDSLISVVTTNLIAGNAVALSGLAKFETRDRPARQVRNVATGEMIDKDADRAVKITPLGGIKDLVNNA